MGNRMKYVSRLVCHVRVWKEPMIVVPSAMEKVILWEKCWRDSQTGSYGWDWKVVLRSTNELGMLLNSRQKEPEPEFRVECSERHRMNSNFSHESSSEVVIIISFYWSLSRSPTTGGILLLYLVPVPVGFDTDIHCQWRVCMLYAIFTFIVHIVGYVRISWCQWLTWVGAIYPSCSVPREYYRGDDPPKEFCHPFRCHHHRYKYHHQDCSCCHSILLLWLPNDGRAHIQRWVQFPSLDHLWAQGYVPCGLDWLAWVWHTPWL